MNRPCEYLAHFRCPSCGSMEIARIQWGRPLFTDKLEAALDAGTVVLGGCMMEYDSPRWRCRSCGHEFGDLGNQIFECLVRGIKVPDYMIAYDETMNNRDDLERSIVCGCFWCESIYSPREIQEWVPDDLGTTAVCPRCGHDSVFGDASGCLVSKDLLKKMHSFWVDGECLAD